MPSEPPAGNQPSGGLSARTVAVMELIADGHTYEQILRTYPDFTYHDIFAAAREVLDAGAGPTPYAARFQQIRYRYPRAYERWTDEEDARLRQLIKDGLTVARIATQLQRQRSAIRSRIVRLGLADLLSLKEKARLERTHNRDQRNA